MNSKAICKLMLIRDEAEEKQDEQSTHQIGLPLESEFVSLDQLPVTDSAGKKPEECNNRKSKPKPDPDVLKVKKTTTARRSCYKQYTAASMWAALERIEQGLSVYRASLEYGVPRKTLRNWMKKYNILSYFDLRKQEKEKLLGFVNLE